LTAERKELTKTELLLMGLWFGGLGARGNVYHSDAGTIQRYLWNVRAHRLGGWYV